MLRVPEAIVRTFEEIFRVQLTGEALRSHETKEFLSRIAAGVAEISEGLTLGRDQFIADRYLKDQTIRDAYLLYYTTTNLLKLWPPLRELARSIFFGSRTTLRHLDIGAGTGAAIWGLKTYLDSEQPGIERLDTLATDLLEENLVTTKRFRASFQNQLSTPDIALETMKLDVSAIDSLHPRSFDLITMMNVMNEVDEAKDAATLDSCANLLSENGALIMIEPASREESRRALRFRDRARERGWFVFAPCCRSGRCPALLKETDWCHTEVPWERPGYIRQIDDLVGTLRLSLKSTYFILLRTDDNLVDRVLGSRDFKTSSRVVSEQFREKGRLRYFTCNEHGREENVLNKRDRSQSNAQVGEITRYDLVYQAPVERRTHDVKLSGATCINILSRPDGCGYVDNTQQ